MKMALGADGVEDVEVSLLSAAYPSPGPPTTSSRPKSSSDLSTVLRNSTSLSLARCHGFQWIAAPVETKA